MSLIGKIISKVETNSAGRVLRMQDAKRAFLLNSKNCEIVQNTMPKAPGYNLVTKDVPITEKLAKMYPPKAQSYETMSNAEKIATLQKRSDCRFVFGKKKVGTLSKNIDGIIPPKKTNNVVSKIKKLFSKKPTVTPLFPEIKKLELQGKIKFKDVDPSVNYESISELKKLAEMGFKKSS